MQRQRNRFGGTRPRGTATRILTPPRPRGTATRILTPPRPRGTATPIRTPPRPRGTVIAAPEAEREKKSGFALQGDSENSRMRAHAL